MTTGSSLFESEQLAPFLNSSHQRLQQIPTFIWVDRRYLIGAPPGITPSGEPGVISMRNRRTYPNIGRSTSRAAMRSTFAGIIMLWASIAVVHAAQVRQPTRDEVKGADQVQSGENALAKRIEEENVRLDRLLRGICRGC
jgi:hypothetical protein